MRVRTETIDIPRGTVHQMWNPGSSEPGAAKPEPVVRGLLAVLAPLGRLRGYGPT